MQNRTWTNFYLSPPPDLPDNFQVVDVPAFFLYNEQGSEVAHLSPDGLKPPVDRHPATTTNREVVRHEHDQGFHEPLNEDDEWLKDLVKRTITKLAGHVEAQEREAGRRVNVFLRRVVVFNMWNHLSVAVEMATRVTW